MLYKLNVYHLIKKTHTKPENQHCSIVFISNLQYTRINSPNEKGCNTTHPLTLN